MMTKKHRVHKADAPHVRRSPASSGQVSVDLTRNVARDLKTAKHARRHPA